MKAKLALAAAALLLVFVVAELAVRSAELEMWLPGEAEPEGIMHRRSPDPLLVYELRPGARIPFPREGGDERITLEVNALGFRDRVDLTMAKPPGRKRILLVGDSIAFGLGVALEDTLGKRLETELGRRSPVECIAVAVSGYDALQSVQLLRSKGLSLQPDAIVFAYNLTDTMDFSGELGQFFEALAYSDPMPGDGLRRALVPRSQFARWVFWRLSRLRKPDVAKVRRVEREMEDSRRAYIDAVLARYPQEPTVSAVPAAARSSSPPLPAPWNDVEAAYRDPETDRRRRAALLDLKDLGRETGLPIVVALIPAFVDRRPYPFTDLERALVADIQRLGLPVVPLAPILEGQAVGELSYDSLHPTAKGHALLARHLAEALIRTAVFVR